MPEKNRTHAHQRSAETRRFRERRSLLKKIVGLATLSLAGGGVAYFLSNKAGDNTPPKDVARVLTPTYRSESTFGTLSTYLVDGEQHPETGFVQIEIDPGRLEKSPVNIQEVYKEKIFRLEVQTLFFDQQGTDLLQITSHIGKPEDDSPKDSLDNKPPRTNSPRFPF